MGYIPIKIVNGKRQRFSPGDTIGVSTGALCINNGKQSSYHSLDSGLRNALIEQNGVLRRLPADSSLDFSPPWNSSATWAATVAAYNAAVATPPSTANSTVNTAAGSLAGYRGAIVGANGYVYFIPYYNNAQVAKLNPANNAITLLGSSLAAGSWQGGALATNGYIYVAGAFAGGVLSINTNVGGGDAITTIAGPSTSQMGAVALPNGKVVLVPRALKYATIFNPADNTYAVTTTFSNGTETLCGGVLSPQGYVYAGASSGGSKAPYYYNLVKFGPVDQTAAVINGLPTGYLTAGGVLAPNGYIYWIPNPSTAGTVTSLYKLNPSTDTFSTIPLTVPASGWVGGVLGPDGYIYAFPGASGNNILRINPSNDAVTTIACSTAGFYCGCVAPTGAIYAAPYTASQILQIGGSYDWPLNLSKSGYFNKF